jgi:glycosyltransferase involved in cell wall biosynthesis
MNKSIRLCIITTHPIQYMAPWFRELSSLSDIDLNVIFFRELNPQQQGIGFGQAFKWDIPLRQGYESHVLCAPSGLRSITLLLSRLRKVLSVYRPDAVLITGWNEPGLIGANLLAKLMKIPILLRGESNILRTRTLFVKVLHRLLMKLPSGFTVIGRANRQLYLNNGVHENKLFEGAYFVESSRMLKMASDNASNRSVSRLSLGYETDDFVFCFSGKHVPFKRPMLIVEAAALLRSRGWPIKLHYSGAGELTNLIRQRATDLAIPIHFTGFLNQTEMWKAYLPADAFVLPSNNGETWGLVTNEAMLFGLPVIVSDQVGCAQDLVRHGETGYIFTGGAEGLAEAMETMLKNTAQVTVMGQRARQLVLDSYSMPVATRGLKAALQAVCK